MDRLDYHPVIAVKRRNGVVDIPEVGSRQRRLCVMSRTVCPSASVSGREGRTVNILLLMMGGIGSRFGSPIPKQFTEVDGKPLFRYILDAYDGSGLIDRTVIVCNSDWIDVAKQCMERFPGRCRTDIVSGGDTRSQSVKNAILYLKEDTGDDSCILIHDTTHPYLDRHAVEEAISMMGRYDGVTLCQREYDTCYSIDEKNVLSEIPKKSVVSGGSPEIFRFGDLYRMYSETSDEVLDGMSSAGALALNNGLRIGYVPMSVLNIKITRPGDMDLFRNLVSTYYFR